MARAPMRGDHFLVTEARPIRNGDARSIEGHVIPAKSVTKLSKLIREIAELKGELAAPNHSQLIAEVGTDAVEDMLTASKKAHSEITSRAKKDSFVILNILLRPPEGNQAVPQAHSIEPGYFLPLAKIKEFAAVIDKQDKAILRNRYPNMYK